MTVKNLMRYLRNFLVDTEVLIAPPKGAKADYPFDFDFTTVTERKPRPGLKTGTVILKPIVCAECGQGYEPRRDEQTMCDECEEANRS